MSVLDQIDTVVAVIMENRSFDHLLGWMSLAEYGGRQDIEGLKGGVDPASRELVDPSYDNYALGHRWRPFVVDRDIPLITDVPHGRASVATQLDYSQVIGGFTMAGFARAYFDANQGNRGSRPEALMMFPPPLVPTTSFLAQNFCVCDRWFTPIPTDTQPNRFIALGGETQVDETSDHPPDHDVILDWCTRNGVRWRVYHEGFSFMTLFRRSVLLNPNFRWFGQLASDFQLEADSTFPQVILVEPAYDDDPLALHPDDNHPPLPMGPGEVFLSRVYKAVTSNPSRWARTVLIIYYDEHGGFFDHVQPLQIRTAAPNKEYPPFDTTGPRVPALVVSPFVRSGSVCSENLDHTSVLRFLAERFTPGKAYSAAVANRHGDGTLKSVFLALNVAVPRPAKPPNAPALGLVPSITRADLEPSTANQRAFANAQADAHASHPDAIVERHPEMLFDVPHPDVAAGTPVRKAVTPTSSRGRKKPK